MITKNVWNAVRCCVLLASAGCSRHDHRPVAGDYVLKHVDGRKTPAILTQSAGCTIVLISSAMRIGEADTFSSTFTIMKHCADSVAPAPDLGTRGAFSTSGDTIFFNNAQGLSGGTGVFHGDTIVVQGARHALTYVKKPTP